MLDLIEYLNKYFRGTTDKLIEEMAEKFGVDVKHTPNFPSLWLFKYNQLTAQWRYPLTHMCRGVIVELTNDGSWKIVSYPFDKFFNLHEPNCVLTPEDYIGCPANYYLSEKADGTCIQVYFYDGAWRVSTLGTIVTMNLHGSNEESLCFEKLFWQTLERRYSLCRELFCATLDVWGHHTYVFELCTSQNRVVTRYSQDRVYLLGIRELTHSYRLWTFGECEALTSELKIHSPRYISCFSYPSLEELKTFVEAEGRLGVVNDAGVEYPEGYVVILSGRPIAKIKNSQYLTLHAVIGGENDRYVAKQLAEHLFNETLDDVMPALSEYHKAGVEEMREVLRKINAEAFRLGAALKEWLSNIDQSIPDLRKQYALKVQDLTKELDTKPKGWISGYFYKNFDEIRQGFLKDFTEVLKGEVLRTRENLDYWKDIVLKGMEQKRSDEKK